MQTMHRAAFLLCAGTTRVSLGGGGVVQGAAFRSASLSGVRRPDTIGGSCLPARARLILGGRSTVGHGALDAVIGVRIPASQPLLSA